MERTRKLFPPYRALDGWLQQEKPYCCGCKSNTHVTVTVNYEYSIRRTKVIIMPINPPTFLILLKRYYNRALSQILID